MVRRSRIKEMREELAQLEARWKELQGQARKRKLWEKVQLIGYWHYHVWGVEHEYENKTHASIHKYGKLKVVERFRGFRVYHKDELVLEFGEGGKLEKYRPGTWERTLVELYRKVLEDKLHQDIHKLHEHLLGDFPRRGD